MFDAICQMCYLHLYPSLSCKSRPSLRTPWLQEMKSSIPRVLELKVFGFIPYIYTYIIYTHIYILHIYVDIPIIKVKCAQKIDILVPFFFFSFFDPKNGETIKQFHARRVF